MANVKPKTIDGLMKHLRKKGVLIKGSKQKNELKNIGYYHAYKGYKFIKKSSNPIIYTDFKQLKAVYEFDSSIKSLFYSQIMFIETSLKNRVLDIVVNEVGSESFVDIYNLALDDYKRLSPNGKTFLTTNARQQAEKNYNNAINACNKLRDQIFKTTSKAYSDSNQIAVHYQQKGLQVPIWGIFEMISLGDFGYFVKNLNLNIRKKISKEFGINPTYDVSAEIPHRLIFAIKDLRNSIAHNNVVFDTRFKTAKIANSVLNLLYNELNISVNFEEIFDYLCLIVFMLKKLGLSKTSMRKFVSEFQSIVTIAKNNLPFNIFSKFISTNIRHKINLLNSYISKK